jgi:lysophospholipase L1-like esterase
MRVRLLVVLLAAVAGLAACGSSRSSGSPPPTSYYVSVGDSLSVGVQPNGAGLSLPTNQGYADDLSTSVRVGMPGLQLVELGCSGETTETMTQGGKCSYSQGNQLAAAAAFLRAHQGKVAFITIDLGGNDVVKCVGGGSVDGNCVMSGLARIQNQLPAILQHLRSAAGAQPRIVGMDLYNIFLAQSLSGPSGQGGTDLSFSLARQLNATFASIYRAAGDRMAEVGAAFATTDTTPTALTGRGTVPTNVARICQWTWTCAPPPVGPNLHANVTGYQVIAAAFRPLV